MPENSRLIDLLVEWEERLREGQEVSAEELAANTPDLLPDLKRRIADLRKAQSFLEAGSTVRGGTTIHPMPPPPSVPGYEILSELGRGGMGVVYKARQARLDRVVALKMILAGARAGPEELARFQREARAAARLRHPHICPIHEVGEYQDRPYIVMGFIHGEDLRAWARKLRPTAHQAAQMVALLARAVGHAHEHGVIHRDIKPSNVMIDAETGQPVLMDFGLAKELAEQGSELSQSGQIMGTPAYMAPEQAAGHPGQVGPPSDVYALGAVLYELLCGRPPFVGTVGDVLRAVQTEWPLPPRSLAPRLHRDLETICLKAMAKEPGRRYPSALALAEDLERFVGGEAILARREGLGSRVWRKVRRNPLVSAAVLATVLAAAVAGYVAPRVYHDRQAAALDRRIADLSADVEVGLQTPELTAEYLPQMEARLAELEGLAADRAVAFRPRLHQGFADLVRSRFRDRLAPDDVLRLREAVALLRPCDPELAGRVGQELEERLARWESVFELDAPFSRLPEVFERSRVSVQQQEGASLLAPVKHEPTVATTVTCAGRVRLEAVFHPSWQTASRLGLVLNAGKGTGYNFLLVVPAEPTGKPQPPASFEEVRRAGGTISLVIQRNQVVLQERRLPAGELFEGSGGTLRLVAQREGEALSFQVNRLKPLEAREVFPLSTSQPGTFALVWPLKVRLQGLRALHQVSPVTASALEEGDDRYNQADYERAIVFYQKVQGASPDEGIRREARYKEGLCLLALNREDEALTVLEEVAVRPLTLPSPPTKGGESRVRGGDRGRWANLADSQLLLLHLRRKDLPNRLKAESILDRLADRHDSRSQELALSLTPAERHEIYKSYCGAGVGFLLRKPEDVVHSYERASRAAALFAPDARAHFNIKLLLVRAYRLAGQEREALEKCSELLRDYGDVFRVYGASATTALEEYGWLLRQRNRPADQLNALGAVNKWLLGEGGIRPTRDGAAYVLLLERARIHAAMQKTDLAEKDLELFFRHEQQGSWRAYAYHSAACLLQGFLRQQRGDDKGAREAWRRGLLTSWREAFPSAAVAQGLDETDNTAFVHHLILAALCGEPSDPEKDGTLLWLSSLLQRDAALAGGSSMPTLALKIIPANAFRQMWLTPRGRQWAQRFAFRNLTLAEYFQVPLYLLAAETLRQGAFPPGALPAEQDDLIWKLVQDLYAAYLDGRLPAAVVPSLLLTWKPIGLFGSSWKEVDRALESQLELRGPTAYVLGHRYLRLGKKPEAVKFFTIARKDAPPDSPLARLAQAELDRMEGPQK